MTSGSAEAAAKPSQDSIVMLLSPEGRMLECREHILSRV